MSVRLSGSPIARDLEKYIEVFTEGVKCWRPSDFRLVGSLRTLDDPTQFGCIGQPSENNIMLSVCPPNSEQALFPVPLGTYSGPKKKTKTKLM